jgi:DNA-binding NtrC family response regulator
MFDDCGQMRTLAAIEAEIIQRTLAMNSFSVSLTAKNLGIGRSTLYRKMQELEKRTAHEYHRMLGLFDEAA